MQNSEYVNMEYPHNVILEGRSQLRVSGVSEVISFDECEVVMETNMGVLVVSGTQLHVEKLSLDVGELTVQGQIQGIQYTEETRQKGGFWSKIF